MKSVTIEMSSVIRQSEQQVSAEVDGEVVMMSVEQGSYYGLDEVGSRIWELTGTPSTVDAICDALVVEYQVERSVCERDVIRFLEEMAEQGLVEIDGPAD